MKKLLTLTILALCATAAAAKTTIGAFTLITETDPLTDVDSSYMYVNGLTDDDATLFFTCKTEGLRVVFQPTKYIGSTEDTYEVTYRLDKLPAVGPRGWNSSTTGKSVFLPQSGNPAFLTAAKSASTIIVQVRDYNEVPITESFNLTGLAEALTKLPCARGF